MFTREEISRNLLGCFEIFLFVPEGVARFDADWQSVVRSFVVPFVFMPVVLIVVAGLFPEFPASLIMLLTVLRTVISAALFFAVVYFITKQFDRQEHFYRFLIIFNWTNINGMVLILPILAGLVLGYDAGNFEVYALFSQMMGYVYVGFVITHCFRIPWEMGGFLAVVSLAINENVWDVADLIRDSAML